MNYLIALQNLYPEEIRGSNKRVMDTELCDMDEFIERHSIERFIYNMDYMWFWDVRGLDGYEADGPCVFVEFKA